LRTYQQQQQQEFALVRGSGNGWAQDVVAPAKYLFGQHKQPRERERERALPSFSSHASQSHSLSFSFLSGYAGRPGLPYFLPPLLVLEAAGYWLGRVKEVAPLLPPSSPIFRSFLPSHYISHCISITMGGYPALRTPTSFPGRARAQISQKLSFTTGGWLFNASLRLLVYVLSTSLAIHCLSREQRATAHSGQKSTFAAKHISSFFWGRRSPQLKI
jgi:hypothetical protein